MKKEIYNLEGIEIEVEKYDIKDMQKRYIPEKARFYRAFFHFRAVIFLSRNVDVNRLFRSLSGTELP